MHVFDTAETRLPNRSVPAAAAAYARVHGTVPHTNASDPTVAVPVILNHGRWLVECPWCPGAQYASATDLRFFCDACDNEAVGFKWVRIVWPPQRQAIERICAARPVTAMSWRPPETIADLIAENRQMGVADGAT